MALDQNRLQKPFSKLRKLLRKLPKDPSPEQVHDIRTRTRRVEANLQALLLDRKRKGRRVLKAVTPVRKRAGKVRDMDVLTGFASTLSPGRDEECLVQLLEHLGRQRFQDSRKLNRAVAKQQSIADRSLKRCASAINRNFRDGKGQNEWPSNTAATALRLSGELAKWPRLTRNNLHPFRLKVKELRYILQLSGDRGRLVELLGEVKDKIGEWHDWTELATIAEDVLQHSGCEVIAQIRAGTETRFNEAIKLANHLRQDYFGPARSSTKQGTEAGTVKEPVLKATSRLAA